MGRNGVLWSPLRRLLQDGLPNGMLSLPKKRQWSGSAFAEPAIAAFRRAAMA